MFLSSILFCFLLGLLSNASLGNHYCLQGLRVFLTGAVPALLPFMILSGVIIRLGKTETISAFFHPLIGRLYHVSKNASYVIFIGFLCGFPMGAKTISELHERKRLSREEARWLLAFCNNAGPAFLFSIVLPLYQVKNPWPFLLGQYGIPLLYGLILQRTIYKGLIGSELGNASLQCTGPASAVAESVKGSMDSMMILGGYVIFFNLLNLIPHLLFHKPCPIFGPIFEITTGIIGLDGKFLPYVMSALAFGGLSCLAQTYSSLNDELKGFMKEYFIHKLVISVITFAYYELLSGILL